METSTEYTRSWVLSAGETDARGLMPVTLVAARAIEIATLHANSLSIGYSDLAEHRLGWVLVRLTINMLRYPGINETYSMTTWVEGFNRYFSDRCFVMTDAAGEPLAHIRSTWVAIDMATRKMANLSEPEHGHIPLSARPCPVDKCPRPAMASGAPSRETFYTFKYSDIDFNRHVNTIRYLDLVLNQRQLDFYDGHDIVVLDASFDHECRFGQEVKVVTGPDRRTDGAEVTEIVTADGGERAVGVKLTFSPRNNSKITE